MACETGERATVVFAVRIAWWVKPYLFAAALFLKSVRPFVEECDGRIEGFIERQADFVARHGVSFVEVRKSA